MDLSTRCKIVVAAPVNAYEKEYVRNLAQRALISSSISPGTGPAIVVIGNSRIMGTSLSVESSDFFEQLKILPTVQIDADSTITVIEERVRAALNDFSAPVMVRELSLLPLLIVCPPFETGNERHDIPTVDVLCGPEEIKLAWVPSDNFEFTVMDIRQALSPRLLRAEVPLVTSLGHYQLLGNNCSGGIFLDSHVRGHMVRDEGLLTDLQLYATPRMARLRNGTNFPIVGIGRMKTEAFDIPRVELAPGLKVNFVSLNQLDRDHGLFCCFRGKELKIRKDDETVVGAGVMDDDGIFMLQHLQVSETEI